MPSKVTCLPFTVPYSKLCGQKAAALNESALVAAPGLGFQAPHGWSKSSRRFEKQIVTLKYIGKHFSRPLLEKKGKKKRGEGGEVEKRERESQYCI